MKKERVLKAALFDLDGTLCDTEPAYIEFWEEMGRLYRPDIDNLIARIQGIPPMVSIETYFPHVRDIVTEGILNLERTMPYAYFPGALDFIHDLKRHGVKCAVVTSSNRYKMSCVADALPGFSDDFDEVLTMERFSRPKPAPDCFLLGAEVFGCAADECVVFEDSFSGLKAGTDAGIFTVALATSNSRESLAGRADLIIDSFSDISYDSLCNAIITSS